jgi:hypothetical protein
MDGYVRSDFKSCCYWCKWAARKVAVRGLASLGIEVGAFFYPPNMLKISSKTLLLHPSGY